MTGEIDQGVRKSSSRLEKSLKKHVKQYRPSIFATDTEFSSKDKKLINGSNRPKTGKKQHYAVHNPALLAGVYGDIRREKSLNKARR